jgi:hypothetical protein
MQLIIYGRSCLCSPLDIPILLSVDVLEGESECIMALLGFFCNFYISYIKNKKCMQIGNQDDVTDSSCMLICS